MIVVYIILFIIMMLFVFSIGMLRHYMPRREVLLVLLVSFLIGSIGGAFFLEPIYNEIPSAMGLVEKNMPNNEETLYLDLSSSIDIDELQKNLSSMEGFKSFKETSVSIPMWSFNEREYEYFNFVLSNIDSHYTDYNITSSGRIDITFEDNYTAAQALKSFSDWYKLVYGGTISYAQIHAQLVVSSSSLDEFKQVLLDRGIVASNIEGPVQNLENNTNSSLLTNTQFTLVCGGIGIVVAILGIYFDSFVVAGRRIKKFFGRKR